MQVVLLAAGKSKRFHPFNTHHKSLTPLLGKPLIIHTLHAIQKAGITDVVIVANDPATFKRIVDADYNLKAHVSYVAQEEALGMGDALCGAESVLQDEFFVMNAYHVDFFEIQKLLQESRTSSDQGAVLVKGDADATRHGIVEVEDGLLKNVIEKPINLPESPKRIVGVYLLTKQFLAFAKEAPQSDGGFEEALSKYAKDHTVHAVESDIETISLKYPWDLLDIKDYLLKSISSFTSKTAKVSENALIDGEVYIEDGVEILDGAQIKGPCYLGKDSFVGTNALLRNGVDLETGVKVGSFMEVKNAVIFSNSTTHTGFIGDSVIGADTKIGAAFTTGNVRLDREGIRARVEDVEVQTNKKSLGAVVGDKCVIGIGVNVMPGIVIGNNVTVGPGTVVMKNIDSHTQFYTKFQEHVEKKKQ